MAPLTLEERFVELQNAKQNPRNSHPKIQRVATYLVRNRKDFAKHYYPRLVSIGPIHHGDENLQLGEKYKLIWAAKYIENIKSNPQDLHKKISDNIEQLKDLFSEDVLAGFSLELEGFNNSLEEKLSWLLFVDGCSLLHVLGKAKLHDPDQMNLKVDQLVLVMMDVLLLENQVPFLLLKLLWNGDEFTLLQTMKCFLSCHHWNNEYNISDPSTVKVLENEYSPTHLLDLQRRIILPGSYNKISTGSSRKDNTPARAFGTCELQEDVEGSNNKISRGSSRKDNTPAHFPVCIEPDNNKKQDENSSLVKNKDQNNSNMTTYRNIQDLKAAGVTLKSSKTRRPTDVYFSHGWLAAELTLPEIVVDDTTASTFLNLIAYETCPDFENDYGICSFAAFMDSLIDHPEDVKALRSKGILLNSLGSDEDVAKLFNIISTDLVPDTIIYSGVRGEIEKHYKNKWKTWIAIGFHTYFSNPWAIIAFVAATLALALTFVQTWFSIHPAS